MKPLTGDTQISRSVSLYCSEGKRNGSMVAFIYFFLSLIPLTLDKKTTKTTNNWLLSLGEKYKSASILRANGSTIFASIYWLKL